MGKKEKEKDLIKYSWNSDIREIVIPIHVNHEDVDSIYKKKLTDEEWYILCDVIYYMWKEEMFDQTTKVLLDIIDIYQTQILKNERNENGNRLFNTRTIIK